MATFKEFAKEVEAWSLVAAEVPLKELSIRSLSARLWSDMQQM